MENGVAQVCASDHTATSPWWENFGHMVELVRSDPHGGKVSLSPYTAIRWGGFMLAAMPTDNLKTYSLLI
jgi:hypothetical protein